MKAERGGRPWRSVARASRVALVGAFQEQRAIRCVLPCRKLAWTDAMVPQTGSFADKSRGIADMTNRFARAKVGRLPTSQRGGGKDLCGGRDDADGTPTSSRYLTSVEYHWHCWCASKASKECATHTPPSWDEISGDGGLHPPCRNPCRHCALLPSAKLVCAHAASSHIGRMLEYGRNSFLSVAQRGRFPWVRGLTIPPRAGRVRIEGYRHRGAQLPRPAWSQDRATSRSSSRRQ